MVFHRGQREAGNAIINKFEEGLPFAVLLAQMQSGKTGSYLFTAYEMVRKGVVNRVIIICGSAETSLREQAKDDEKSAQKAYQEELINMNDMDGVKRIIFADIGVHFSNDLSGIRSVTENTLIVHEECHMAQSKTNKPYKEFYRQNGLEGALLGDFSKLREKKNYILGVSATPFSEIVANHRISNEDIEDTESEIFASMNVEPEEKYVYQMKPGDEYLGVPDFYREGSIKFTAKKIKGSESHFFQVLVENMEKYMGKYCIVRTFESKGTHQIIADTCTRLGYDCIHSFGGEESIQKRLLKKPVNLTVIHISGRCRMGQVLDKTHIGMVYESSNNPNADTILQGLVGRVCGYDTTTSIDVYISSNSEEHIIDYSNSWTGGGVERLGKISQAMNLSGGRKTTLKAKDKDGLEIIPIHPICIPSELLEIDTQGDLGWQIHQCLEENPGLIKCAGDANDIKERILNSGKFHKSTRTNHEADENMLKSSIQNHKRVRPGKLKSVNNCPQKYSLEDNPFILYKRKDSKDYYLGGWIRYREEIHSGDEIDRPTPKVSPECNYVPSVETTTDSLEKETQKGDFTPSKETSFEKKPTGISINSPSKTPSKSISTETCEVYEIGPMPRMVCEVDTIEEFIGTIKNLVKKGMKSYRPLWMVDNPESVAVHLKLSVFSKEVVENIKKQLKLELGIKLKVKGTPGRPSKREQEYRKMKEITW